MCKAWDNSMNEARKEGKREGIKEGIKETKKEDVKLLHKNGFSVEQISKGLGLKKALVYRLINS